MTVPNIEPEDLTGPPAVTKQAFEGKSLVIRSHTHRASCATEELLITNRFFALSDQAHRVPNS